MTYKIYNQAPFPICLQTIVNKTKTTLNNINTIFIEMALV